MFFGVWDFILQSSYFWDFPLVAFTCAVQTSTEALHASNRACKELPWCRFPTPPSDRPQIAAQGRVSFLRPKQAYPSPLKGEGLGIVFLGLALLVHSWATLAQQGRSGASVVLLPTPSSKPHTGPHRGEFGFIVFSWCASFAEVPQAGTPGGNSPPLGWAGW